MAAHPCNDGICDAKSKCEYNLQSYDNEKYGSDVWGINGSIIKTTRDYFKVKTDFISEENQTKLYKIRTTIT